MKSTLLPSGARFALLRMADGIALTDHTVALFRSAAYAGSFGKRLYNQ